MSEPKSHATSHVTSHATSHVTTEARRRIGESPLSIDRVVDAVRHRSAGGICVFVGVVRDHNEGRAVDGLSYEAFVEMAEREMEGAIVHVAGKYEGVRLEAEHRIGQLEVGDLAVVCAASAPHRDDAFAACRALIDRIKETVPIWKHERGEGGPRWVGWTTG